MPRKITSINPEQQRFSVWLNYWLEVYAKPNVTISTYKGYNNMVKRHIIPKLGEVKLCGLTVRKLQMFFNAMAKCENSFNKNMTLSQKTLKNIYDVIHIALKSAVEAGIITENNLEKIVMPKCSDRNENFLDLNEQVTLLQYAKNLDSLAACGIVLLLDMGLKKKELLSLKWSDIDFKSHTLVLSNRKIPIVRSDYEYLNNHKKKQRTAMEKKGMLQTEDTLVLANRKFSKYTSEGYNRFIKRAADNCGFDNITATTLRNTFGAECIRIGGSLPIVSYLMGDCCVRITRQRYKKLIEELSSGNSPFESV